MTEVAVYSPELDYSIRIQNHSDHIYRYVYPQNSASVTLGTGLAGPTSIIVPPSAINYSKSSLNWNVQVGASNSTYYNYINANTFTALARFRMFDQFSNAVPQDISNFNLYAVLVIPACQKLETFLSKSFVGFVTDQTLTPIMPASTLANSQLYTVEDIGRFNIQPLYSQLTTYVAFYFPAYNVIAGNTTSAFVDMAIQNAYTGRRQFYIGTENTATYLDVSAPLSALKFAYVGIDRETYSPANQQIDLYWNNTDNFCFQSTISYIGSADVSGGTASLGTVTSVNSCVIANISMTLACENNLALVSQVIERVTSGAFRMPIPWVTVTRYTVASSQSHSYQIPLSSAYGNTLLCNIVAPFYTHNTGASAALANVHQRDLLATYNTFLNNISIANPQTYNVLQSADYLIGNRKYLRGSAVQTMGEYIYGEWMHIDSWFGTRPIHEVDPTELDGLDLRRQNAVWQLQATLASPGASYTWVNVLCGQKILQITSQGMQVY